MAIRKSKAAKPKEAAVDETVEESFPASDPPAHAAPGKTEPAPSSGYDADAEARSAKIRDRAYALWEEYGRPDGRHDEHWLQAEREASGAAKPKRAPRKKKPAE